MLEDLMKKYEQHLAAEPRPPVAKSWQLVDATPEAVNTHLNEISRSIGIMCNEGEQILGGRILGNLGNMNSGWGGSPINVSRKESGSFVVYEPRITISAMTQEKSFEKFEKKGEGLARDIGFLARMLICEPVSMKGFRGTDSIGEIDLSFLDPFHHRITELLDESCSESDLNKKPRVLEFSDDAKVAWRDCSNHFEWSMAPNGAYHSISDAASKAAENVARIAALFHLYENREGKIKSDSVVAAWRICEWYLQEFLRLFGPEWVLPEHEVDAISLDAWFRRVLPARGSVLKRNFVRHFGPAPLRNKDRLQAAINVLICAQRVVMFQDPKTRTVYLQHNPLTYPYVQIKH